MATFHQCILYTLHNPYGIYKLVRTLECLCLNLSILRLPDDVQLAFIIMARSDQVNWKSGHEKLFLEAFSL